VVALVLLKSADYLYKSNTYCQSWPARAVERYTGPFNRKLVNKILVIGTSPVINSTYRVLTPFVLGNYNDPVTPLGSAERVA
jgi:membrane-associated HD superfamily phosphohydrolase